MKEIFLNMYGCRPFFLGAIIMLALCLKKDPEETEDVG